jgi:hypothetical protein
MKISLFVLGLNAACMVEQVDSDTKIVNKGEALCICQDLLVLITRRCFVRASLI